jgi:hypothetical protein
MAGHAGIRIPGFEKGNGFLKRKNECPLNYPAESGNV